MWNLSGNDIEQAKEQLKGRRAAIKARYDEEMKRVDDELAAIEKFEREAREFLANFKPDSAPTEIVTESEGPGEADDTQRYAVASFEPMIGEQPGQSRDPMPEAASDHPGASRWRLRLNAGAGEAA